MLTKLTLIFSSLLFSFSAECFDHDYKNWNSVLKQYVVKTKYSTAVKYKEMGNNVHELNLFIKEIESVSKENFDTWTDNQKIAFYINAYNALTVKLVADEFSKNNNLKSIKSIGGTFGNPWKIKFFTLFGEKTNLDHIEHNLARKQFDEPRMHFAFNCASIGCPALQPRAFTARDLERQLQTVTIEFFLDKTKNRFNSKNMSAEVSSIFKWYGDDFVKSKKYGSLERFLSIYLPLGSKEKEDLLNKKIPVTFLEYDWNLNNANP